MKADARRNRMPPSGGAKEIRTIANEASTARKEYVPDAVSEEQKIRDQEAVQQRRNKLRQGKAARKNANKDPGQAEQKQGSQRPGPSATTGEYPG
jgi:hypothetical protein